MAKRQNQKLNRSVLQNKISKELFLVGKNSIIEIFDTNCDGFESLIVPDNYNSDKIKEVVRLFTSKKIPVYSDSDTIKYIENKYNIDTSGVFVVLKNNIGKFYSLRELKENLISLKECTVVAFPEIDYEQNLGVMIRTCLALKADFILISNRQQKVFSPIVTKVSMGYNLILPIVRENFLLGIDELKEIGFEVYGLDMGGVNIQDLYYNPKAVFVMGNEGKGLGESILKKCDKVISIPMSKEVESLNVSTSLGVVLYDRLNKLSVLNNRS